MPRNLRRTRRRRQLRRRRRNPRVNRSMMFNPQPVFTETAYAGTFSPNSGTMLKVNINNLPQVAQYRNLYQKYRILKAVWTLIPQYNGQEQNAASYNAGANIYAHGMGRICYAIDDSPDGAPPASEAALLQHNGVKIKPVRTLIKFSNRPVPNTKDANGNLMTLGRKYLNFTDSGIDHFGVACWYTQPFIGQTALANNDFHIYCKVSFQLSDPR